MQPFSFITTAQIISEAGAAGRLASICQARGARRVMIVTDPGIARLSLFAQVIDGFPAAQVGVSVFQEVSADPSRACVLAAVAHARQVQAELIIGFGGGSSMDVAKLVAVLAHPQCSQSIDDLYGIDRVHSRRLPLIQAPTTAGTGSEVTPIAIVTVCDTSKTGIVSPILLPDLALLDAACTLDLPPAVTAATGIDAMVHAIEAYTSKLRRNPLSSILAREALRLLSENLARAVHSGSNLEARQGMLLGACLAGQAFANAPVAAVHALAYPLGGHFHIPHGLSNALVLPHVARFNLPQARDDYAELAPVLLGERLQPGDSQSQAEQFVAELAQLGPRCGLPNRLRDLDIPQGCLRQLAEDAMQQQRLLVNNPREVFVDDALRIYQAAW
ncbi:iron-containing alcohol dehydrogenase [Pseudomonas sp. YQ_6]|jgi:alcohol dehydrogenase class IV|uniref:iron-containing alcohol dehydrogenase n=1 Tax=Pseudomonas TaxID=286 RepID=UPI0001F32049|nr:MULTISPECIES: iron-containing alcohol dehydrogenase [Pseudomonas]HBK52238.1 alcohol dehydrogenase [Pseudomonas sp.]ADR60081.1 Iron-containing alcohol dehydrogenase [Pseudomonas putida BIRD-1]AOX09452.1 alcohol dehydrogenase [Pseudomonas putida JB]AYN10748.1 alcohol dehydrogenase [Pseudomonas putida]MCI1025964.1 iron-containing alcohol dehydrogenase [Pseudomonas putida]